ncbi:phosphopantetheine-binding protein [Actinospica robiniae]|uniref:phosphopantetheine-binding protein n=1 Tax=Actinospica robiniae TaxID=304901 RepID=UPI0004179ECA|nr:phosphopantetheine-binding protein [Actinospica robiniae]
MITRAEAELGTEYAAPVTETQRRLTLLWADRLGIEPVGIEDDFFELGGDSMAAAELQLALEAGFGVEVAAAALFREPTIARLAALIDSRR